MCSLFASGPLFLTSAIKDKDVFIGTDGKVLRPGKVGHKHRCPDGFPEFPCERNAHLDYNRGR